MEQRQSVSVCRHSLLPLLLLVTYSSLSLVQGMTANANDSTRLVNDVITSFDRRLRPIQNQTKPIDVHVTFNLLNILQVDEVEQKIHINAWMNFSWWDEFRRWDPEDYHGISILHPDPLDVWRPRTIISNSLGNRDVFADDYSPFTLQYNGATRWYAGSVLDLSCNIDVTYFPFDTQTCEARFVANEYSSEIRLLTTSPTAGTRSLTPNGEWELKSTSVISEELVFPTESLVRVTVSFTIERRPLYYMINVVVPVMAFSFLSSVGFVLPQSSGERASFAITVLLSLAVFLGVVSGQLPPSSDNFPIISRYLFKLLCLSSFSVLITVLQMRLEPMLPDSCRQNSPSWGDGESNSSKDDELSYKTNKKDKMRDDSIGAYSTSDSKETLYSVSTNEGSMTSRLRHHQNGHAAKLTPEDNNDYDDVKGFANGCHVINGGSRSKAAVGGKSACESNSSSSRMPECCGKVLRLCVSDLVLFLFFFCLWIICTIIFIYDIGQQSSD